MPGIVDADTHIIEHPGIWEHFDSDMYHRRPLLAAVTPMKEGQNRDFVWMINGTAVPKRFGKGSYAVAVGGSDSENNRTDIRNEVRYITNPKARVEDMDKRGVDIEVVFPTVLLAYITDDVDLEVAICRSYNRYMANAWREAGDRMRWVVVPPLRNIEESLREIEFARDNGAVGVFFRGVEGDRSLAESYFSPFTRRRTVWAWPSASTRAVDRPASFRYSTARSLTTCLTCAPFLCSRFRDLVAHKIPERFPNLRFGFIEASASWVPYVLHHLRRSTRASTAGASPDAALEFGPKLFQDYRLYVAAETDEDIPYLISHIGEDHLIMGSDYGHQDQSKDNGIGCRDAPARRHRPRIIEKILVDNPARYYGLD